MIITAEFILKLYLALPNPYTSGLHSRNAIPSPLFLLCFYVTIRIQGCTHFYIVDMVLTGTANIFPHLSLKKKYVRDNLILNLKFNTNTGIDDNLWNYFTPRHANMGDRTEYTLFLKWGKMNI